jgi:response regulator RpfG family c-di-GMP phosphodiesterase
MTERKRRVLIVEDEAAIRELVRFHLALAGFDVAELSDGAAALEHAGDAVRSTSSESSWASAELRSAATMATTLFGARIGSGRRDSARLKMMLCATRSDTTNTTKLKPSRK